MTTEKKTYEPGNILLLTMLESGTFDREAAEGILEAVSDLDRPILEPDGNPSTYLFIAQRHNNIEAVRFLLAHGADPNLLLPELFDECALFDLHFTWDTAAEDLPKRLEIAKLFFEYGADPNLLCDCPETLYDYVLWEVFNDDTPHDWEYICSFFKILIAYGGGGGESHYGKPKLTQAIDKSRIDEYELKLYLCEDGYHLEGHLFDPDGVDIGTV